MTAVPYYPEDIPIVFASDEYFVPYIAVAMQSIMENSGKNCNYHFFVLHQNISDYTINKLINHIKKYEQFKIDFINVSSWFKDKKLFLDIENHLNHITLETYFRLIIPELFSQYEKVIYLDGDLICLTDIQKLYMYDIGDNWLASTRDVLGIGSYYCFGSNSRNKDKNLFDGIASIKKPGNYFCAGVTIFNIKQWTLSTGELFEFAASRKWFYYDQDILNVLCQDKTFLLPLEYQFTDISDKDPYNFLLFYLPPDLKKEYFEAKKSPKIIHFNSFIKKPWNVPYLVPYFETFWGYAFKSAFIDIIISRMSINGMIGKESIPQQSLFKGNPKKMIFPALCSYFIFPWYIYLCYRMIYGMSIPQKSVQAILKAYLFFSYYMLKMYKTLLLQQNAKENGKNAKFLDLEENGFYNGVVSVIIPVYNGGDDLKKLIAVLNAQTKVKKLEIIVIDSGSQDGSVEFLKNKEVCLIEIKKEEFSHSKTRNLGAEKASGDILVFMTQDALPPDFDWIFKLIRPIFMHGAAAATCIEKAKDGCSIFTGVENSEYRNFFRCNTGDRIVRLPKGKPLGVRKREALLSDVACAVKKDIFLIFLYRGGFAEDLDLSIRLLQSGESIAILSSVQIIHSHERPGLYYFSRSYIQKKRQELLFYNYQGKSKSLKKIISTAFFSYYYLQKTSEYIESLQGSFEITDFFEFCNFFWNNLGGKNIKRDEFSFGMTCSSPELDAFFILLLNNYPYQVFSGTGDFEIIKNYFNGLIKNYLFNHYQLINAPLKKQIIDALFKKWLVTLGNNLALYFRDHPDQNNALFLKLEELSYGI